MNPNVDLFILNAKKWNNELQVLREIVLECGLTETFKWKVPCYTFNDKNIIIIAGFKDNFVLSFMKGSLLSDPKKLLEKPGENSNAGRFIRFRSVEDITSIYNSLKAYIFEAIEIEKAGLKINYPAPSSLKVPVELTAKLEELPEFKRAFEALTPGRQKAYILHFSEPKQSKTVIARIEKHLPKILKGKGMNDCTCGFSNKMPYCDGSHKFHTIN